MMLCEALGLNLQVHASFPRLRILAGSMTREFWLRPGWSMRNIQQTALGHLIQPQQASSKQASLLGHPNGG